MIPLQGGHSPGKPEKPGIVREFKNGQGKVREKRKSQEKCVLACGHLPRILFLAQNVQERSYLLGIVKNIVVIVMTVYMSIAVRNNTHFVLYRYRCEGRS